MQRRIARVMGLRLKRFYQTGKVIPYILIFPTIVLLGIFDFYPVINMLGLSLQNYDMGRLYEAGYVGLANFRKIFMEDELFYESLWVSFKWVSIQISLQLTVGLAVALLLNRTFKGRGFIRALVFVPWAISGVLTSILFIMIYNQTMGLLNNLLIDLGVLKTGVAWLGNPTYVFSSVIAADLWRGFPFFAITLLAALQSIPREVNEACEVDGCGKIRQFVSITLPFLKQTIVFTTLLRIVWEFNSIDLIFNLTGGGPMNLTTTLTLYMYKTAILNWNYGYGSALAVVGAAILFVFAVIYLSLNKFGRGIYD
jgi:multiple sugar transport system permease protein